MTDPQALPPTGSQDDLSLPSPGQPPSSGLANPSFPIVSSLGGLPLRARGVFAGIGECQRATEPRCRDSRMTHTLITLM